MELRKKEGKTGGKKREIQKGRKVRREGRRWERKEGLRRNEVVKGRNTGSEKANEGEEDTRPEGRKKQRRQ